MNKAMRELSKIDYDKLGAADRDAFDEFYSICESFRDAKVRGDTNITPTVLYEINRIVRQDKFDINPFTGAFDDARKLRDQHTNTDFDQYTERDLLEFYKSRLEVYGTSEKAREEDGPAFMALEDYLRQKIGKDLQFWLSE